MLMVRSLDLGAGRRARIEADPFFGDAGRCRARIEADPKTGPQKKYKKRGGDCLPVNYTYSAYCAAAQFITSSISSGSTQPLT
jgi:hypothetical protein